MGETIIVTSQKTEVENLSMIHFLSLKFVWIQIIQGILLVLGLLFRRIRLFLYGIALLLVPTIIGHASYPRYGGYLTTGVNALHLLAASIWIGGLFGLIIIPKKENMKDWLKKCDSKIFKVGNDKFCYYYFHRFVYDKTICSIVYNKKLYSK